VIVIRETYSFAAASGRIVAQASRMAELDHFAFGVELAERNIPCQYGLTEALEDVAHARLQ
jgi:predicted HTH domain antitoxin